MDQIYDVINIISSKSSCSSRICKESFMISESSNMKCFLKSSLCKRKLWPTLAHFIEVSLRKCFTFILSNFDLFWKHSKFHPVILSVIFLNWFYSDSAPQSKYKQVMLGRFWHNYHIRGYQKGWTSNIVTSFYRKP